ncbi:amino acid ABC transporter substrate-binding protein [Pelagibius sp. CAU 1746]|uniref:amino acid ABC transporter substrate-binding protein n=1 Tax=Pelagibius sp. CAU 1746 TaxID=3140370 RepID=UPI00325AB5A5
MAKSTLDIVRERGELRCAVHTGLTGMSVPDSQGKWKGLFVDYCRAIAAATLGDPDKVKYVPVSSQQRFAVLQSGEVDLLSRTTTWTLSRDSALGLNFVGVMFYDGQSFLVRKDLGIDSAKGLDGGTICVKTGTTAEQNTADYFGMNGLSFKPVVFEGSDEANTAFFSGRCDALTTDASALTSVRVSNAPNPDDYVVLADRIAKEPLGPTVRADDDQWFDISKWVLNVLINAEEMGITAANAEKMAKESQNPSVKRLLGAIPGSGKALGLDEGWAVRVLTAVGNYGEMYDRHLTPIGLERGQNRLWSDGGLMYGLPIR